MPQFKLAANHRVIASAVHSVALASVPSTAWAFVHSLGGGKYPPTSEIQQSPQKCLPNVCLHPVALELEIWLSLHDTKKLKLTWRCHPRQRTSRATESSGFETCPDFVTCVLLTTSVREPTNVPNVHQIKVQTGDSCCWVS